MTYDVAIAGSAGWEARLPRIAPRGAPRSSDWNSSGQPMIVVPRTARAG